jgi:lipid-binding SYLF domain-containing protein
MKSILLIVGCLVLAVIMGLAVNLSSANASTRAEIDQRVKLALEKLYETSPEAKELGKKAKGILVFPNIIKAGLIVGGQYDEGELIVDGKVRGYYNNVQVSYGLQAGVQTHGYALFFMTDSALEWLDKSDGWEIGVGPSIVVVDTGAATSTTSTTLQSEIYAFFFNQKGFMGALGLQGTKISKIER